LTDPILTLRRTVKWGDCDPAGVVYTPRFSDYVVEAHLASFEHLFGMPPYEFLQPMNLALPAKAMVLEFKRSLWPNETFDMVVRVANIRTRTYDISVEGVARDGVLAFDATLTLICLNRTLRKSQALPEFLLEKLKVATV
jgi:acyl-CoA thioesterase FadM